jgi:uncharacterized protein (DUF1778 family)
MRVQLGYSMKKRENLKIRASEEEKRLFRQAAEEEGLSVSAWIRTHLLALVRRKKA